MNGGTTFVNGSNFELGFGHVYGFLRRGVGYGVPILWETPMLHVAKTGDTMHPLAAMKDWRLTSLDVKPEGDNVRVVIKGRYPNFTGGYEYLISPEGEIVVQSSFTYSGDDFHARETGIKFTVPRQCELLEWDRQAEFSVYPPDHIGRPHGQAKPVAAARDEPAADVGVVGRQLAAGLCRLPLDEAAYQLGDAPVSRLGRRRAVPIERRCKMSARPSKASGSTVYVTDWYGGTNSSGEWIENYGRGKLIKNGQVLESTVKFRFLPPTKSELKK